MWWMVTGSNTSSPTAEGVITTWNLANVRALVTGGPTTPGLAPSHDSWISKDKRKGLVKWVLFAMLHSLNKMASVLKCIQFCSCSLHLDAMFPSKAVMGSWPDILTLIRGLNKMLQALTFTTLSLKPYQLQSLSACLSYCVLWLFTFRQTISPWGVSIALSSPADWQNFAVTELCFFLSDWNFLQKAFPKIYFSIHEQNFKLKTQKSGRGQILFHGTVYIFSYNYYISYDLFILSLTLTDYMKRIANKALKSYRSLLIRTLCKWCLR